MNLDALNWLVNSIISTFKCSECSSLVISKDINIKNINWNSILLDIICPSCSKSSLVKSEVVSLDLTKMNLSDKQIELLKNWIIKKNTNKINSNFWESKTVLNDWIIVELNKDLKKEKLSVSDLFSSLEN